MPTMAAMRWIQRRGPEATLAVLACVVFLGCLGSVDLWGKREQRASAEAIDTIDHDRWLVAQIQGRPRLEKPPLPRWTIATLMELTGRRDEWIVRLPGALAALAMVGLVTRLGSDLGGRSVGLASGLALTSMMFFTAELRQAGNDGPVALFTTLALVAAWRRLHGTSTRIDAGPPGSRRWNLALYIALGLGFLTKGPIILVLVALTLVAYLATVGALGRGLGLLADGRGLLLFLVLALSWPVLVLLDDPNAARVWYLEMAMKAGSAGVSPHRRREILAADWPWMTAPWMIVATMAVFLPFLPRGRAARPGIWFAWWWAVGNLAMFCFWKIAKPNYYLPCLPAVAVLVGTQWVRLTQVARDPRAPLAPLGRLVLQFHWVVMVVAALISPVVAAQVAPQYLGWVVAMASMLIAAAVASAWAWRRGADAGAMAPMVAAWAFAILIGYGVVAPTDNRAHSHRALAATLDRLLPAEARTIMFFHELDEGLWFYLRNRSLAPVPGSQPRYSDVFDLVDDQRANRLVTDPDKRLEIEKRILLDWLARPDRGSQYVLIRNRVYDLFAADLVGRATPVFREQGLKRNELVLLRVEPPLPMTSHPPATTLR
jgi:4-amino-4-deoxy-L-arabinose transferase-like glycosyltransferase